jgi:2-keto-4-pentenoate hydratase
MANHLAARGLSIEAGMVILCGTHTPIQYPVGVNRIEVRMSGLGTVVVQGARSLPKDA